MKITVDKEKCISCGTCVALAEKTFKMVGDDYKAIVIDPPGNDEETIKMATDACPTQAIILE